METILAFIAGNYLWFLIATIILIFALIGYLVDTKKDERFSKGVVLDSVLDSRMEVAKAVNISMNDMVNDKTKIIDNNQSVIQNIAQSAAPSATQPVAPSATQPVAPSATQPVAQVTTSNTNQN